MAGGNLRSVLKTSIYLEPELDRALARRAAAEGIPKAELVRRALREALADSVRPRPSAGVFRGPGDLSDRFDDYLEGFGER